MHRSILNSSTSLQVRSEPTTGLVRWRRNFQLPSTSYSRICIAPLPPFLFPPWGGKRNGGGGASRFFCKVFCFVAMSHGPTGLKPDGGLPCV